MRRSSVVLVRRPDENTFDYVHVYSRPHSVVCLPLAYVAGRSVRSHAFRRCANRAFQHRLTPQHFDTGFGHRRDAHSVRLALGRNRESDRRWVPDAGVQKSLLSLIHTHDQRVKEQPCLRSHGRRCIGRRSAGAARTRRHGKCASRSDVENSNLLFM